jgi:cytochrome P450
MNTQEIRLVSYADAVEALRHRSLRQGLYEASGQLMDDVIVNLHGQAHVDRRRLENRLFRRETALNWEQKLVPAVVTQVLAAGLERGGGDLLDLSRRTMMILAAEIAGIDRPIGTTEEFDRLYDLMTRLSRAALVVHATGDAETTRRDGLAALNELETEFYAPSLIRRTRLISAVHAGMAEPAELPADILTTLLLNQDNLDLPPDVVKREVSYYPWVGSHSTSVSLVHSADHIFRWAAEHPEVLPALKEEPGLLQRFVHESIRLHPASHESRRRALDDVTLSSGVSIPKGSLAVIDKAAANRDTAVFGADAGEYNPNRQVSGTVGLVGVSFGSGFHACLGKQIAAGVLDDEAATPLYGSIVTMIRILLAHGMTRDPDHPAVLDTASTRGHYRRYPVKFAEQG